MSTEENKYGGYVGNDTNIMVLKAPIPRFQYENGTDRILLIASSGFYFSVRFERQEILLKYTHLVSVYPANLDPSDFEIFDPSTWREDFNSIFFDIKVFIPKPEETIERITTAIARMICSGTLPLPYKREYSQECKQDWVRALDRIIFLSHGIIFEKNITH